MIIRTQKQRRFTTVDNAPFQDKRLHWDTRGLLGYLLTKPDGWEIRIEDLLKQEEPEDGSRATGREKIFRMLRELKTYGYLYRDQINGADGRFETICYIYENPNDNPYWADVQEDEQDAGLGEDEAEQLELTAVGKDDHGSTVVGKAAHGETVHGKAVNGNTGDGKAVNGKADHIVITDQRSNTDQVIPEGRKQRLNNDPPHIRQMAALNGLGLTAAQQELMNKLRLAFGFRDAEAAADATRSLINVGIEKWDQAMQDLLDALKGVAKGVVANTLFRDFFALLDEEATAEEINILFGNDKATSWWIAASGMRGLPWPSQVANNLAVARVWQENWANGRPDARQEPARKIPMSNASASLAAFAQRAAQGGDR